LLVILAEHATLFDNHAAGVLPFQPPLPPFFDAEGAGSTSTFLAGWAAAKQADPRRPVILSTADHDFNRLACGSRTAEQLGAALTFLFTWGSVPCLYYGDEVGMRYLPGLPDVEGAICNPAYNRAGCRTPMQWDDGPNAGFSTADASRLYLPIDPDPNRPTVAAQQDDPSSTLNLVRRLIALRTAVPALGGREATTVRHAEYPFVYRRGQAHLVVLNPRRDPATLHLPEVEGAAVLLGSGVAVDGQSVQADGFGYAVLALSPRP
jgi:glycosidase